MNIGNSNNEILNLVNESETSMIITHFDFDFLVDIIEDNLIRRIDPYQPSLPNIISAIEQNFKLTYSNDEVRTLYGVEALEKRNQMYKSIIALLCSRHNLQIGYLDEESVDLYSLCYFLYDFLVSNFRTAIVSFFTMYIYKEKNELYNNLGLNDLKKSKDSSTIYGKKLYKNQKIAIINANLELVLNAISGFDISFEDILNTVYTDKNISKYIQDNIVPINDFYKEIYVAVLSNNNYRQAITTDIRFSLHQMECIIPE